MKDELSRLSGVGDITLTWAAQVRLQHAHLARSGKDGLAQSYDHRRGKRHRAAEYPGRRRPDRPAAHRRWPGVPAHHEHHGPVDRSRAIRRDHLEDGRQWPVIRSASAMSPLDELPAPKATTKRVRSMVKAISGLVDLPTPRPRTPWKLPTQVRLKMEEPEASTFPEDVDYKIVYDTTPFINESINEVFKTLRDAVYLGRRGRPLVPAELALRNHPFDCRACGHRRRLFGHGNGWVQSQ